MLRSIGHALNGWRLVWKEEANFRIQCIVAVVVLCFSIAAKFDFVEMLAITLSMLLVLGAELVNTIVENFLDLLHPEHHPLVGALKDLCAGLVLMQSLGATIIGIATLVHHFL